MDKAKYTIGQVVKHIKQNYRGVIIDVDYSFQPQGLNSPITIKKNIANEQPWYRILVDDSSHITYVKETLLDKDSEDFPISHPELYNYLTEKNGQYTSQQLLN